MMSTKSRIAWIMLIFISSMFAFKYLPRYHEYGYLLASAITVVQSILVFKAPAVDHFLNRRLFYLIGLLGLVVVTFVAVRYIEIESLNVDRWSVIDAFISEVFAGNYPYLGKSHMDNYPGPMPMYFVISLPFYLLGDLSVLSVTGYVIAAVYLFKFRKTLTTPATVLVFILTSFCMYWEVMVRSNIFTFTLLVLCGLVAFDRIPKFNRVKQFLTSVIVGLLLSTRSVFVLAYLIFYLTPLRNKEMKPGLWGMLSFVSALSFGLTFVPLLLLFPTEFREVNPFVIQSSVMMPGGLVTLFAVMALLVSLFVYESLDKFFYSGVVLFVSILMYALYHVVDSGFQSAYTGSVVDISYFLFAMPFLMYFIVKDDTSVKEYQNADVQMSV